MASNYDLALTWDQTSFQGVSTVFTWDSAPSNPSHPRYTWDEVQLIVRAAGDDYTKWTDFEKKSLVKLILKVHGSTITEKKQKAIKQFKIKTKDIKIAINKISNAKIIAENKKV